MTTLFCGKPDIYQHLRDTGTIDFNLGLITETIAVCFSTGNPDCPLHMALETA